jgi:hypothetical protein
MKVRELKQILNELTECFLGSEEWEVVMSKDSEGNSFSPLCDASATEYTPDNDWSGEISSPDIEGVEPNALCLWPTN